MEGILPYFPNFLLIFCRISAFFVVAPIFNARSVPTQFKIGFSGLLAFLITSAIGSEQMAFDGLYLLSIFKETLIGLLLGFVAYLFFSIVQIAGSFADMQIGFSMANIIDPMTGSQAPIIGNFKFTLASLLFLAFNGHHMLIRAILDSYRWVPLSNDVFSRIYSGQVSEFLVHSAGTVFLLAFQMAAPLVVALFLVDAGLGILARTAPQFNVFVVGVPLKLIVGFLLLLLIIPGFSNLFADLFARMLTEMENLTNLLSAGSP